MGEADVDISEGEKCILRSMRFRVQGLGLRYRGIPTYSNRPSGDP